MSQKRKRVIIKGNQQQVEIPPLKELTTENIRKTITGIQNALRENYVFPEQSEELCKSLEDHLDAGDYDKLTEPAAFCDQLTNHLHEIVNDKHIKVMLPEDMPQFGISKDRKKSDNFGLTRAEILPGNTGYIDITMFNPLHVSANHINGAMLFVKDTEALIIDLRKCRGGHGDAVNFLLSYFYESKGPGREILLETFFRPQNKIFHNSVTWTPFKYIKPLYVLISNFTFSGGEHFVFTLKITKKATLVGVTTGGGAHPCAFVGIETGIMFKVPIGRSYNPETNEDWEGKGVSPDISCSEEDALVKAQEDISSKLST